MIIKQIKVVCAIRRRNWLASRPTKIRSTKSCGAFTITPSMPCPRRVKFIWKQKTQPTNRWRAARIRSSPENIFIFVSTTPGSARISKPSNGSSSHSSPPNRSTRVPAWGWLPFTESSRHTGVYWSRVLKKQGDIVSYFSTNRPEQIRDQQTVICQFDIYPLKIHATLDGLSCIWGLPPCH